MYHWIDSRNFPGSKNLQALNLISKTSNHLLRSRFDLNNFKRLPVIKEEGGSPEEEERDMQQNLLRSVFQTHYRNRKGAQMKDPMDTKNFERILASKSITRLPPLASINHLMGNSIKDAEQVWDAQLGKCLMNAKNSGDMNFYRVRPPLMKEECGDCQPIKFLPRKSIFEQNGKNMAGDKGEFGQTRSNRKLKNTPNLGRKISQEKPQFEKIFEGTLCAKSAFNKGQSLLAENIQSTLDGHPNEINCKNVRKIPSSERFSNSEELSRQKKTHEIKKETCHLCEKIFFDPQQYTQHLLTHEIADKFTCKMCKIHFLSLRKYKQHCRDFHFTLSNVIKKQGLDYERKWTPKFECKKCKAGFEMEQNFETHKRIHCEKSLIEKYHLSSKNA